MGTKRKNYFLDDKLDDYHQKVDEASEIKEKIYPRSYSGGGVKLPHIPSKEEMNNCGYLGNGQSCPRKNGQRKVPAGGRGSLINCSTCSFHGSKQRF